MNGLRIVVVYCAPGVEELNELTLPRGSTVREAIAGVRILRHRPELEGQVDAGIWGRRCSLEELLADGDRVEIYRPLTIDPKEGRRLRGSLRRKRRVER